MIHARECLIGAILFKSICYRDLEEFHEPRLYQEPCGAKALHPSDGNTPREYKTLRRTRITCCVSLPMVPTANEIDKCQVTVWQTRTTRTKGLPKLLQEGDNNKKRCNPVRRRDDGRTGVQQQVWRIRGLGDKRGSAQLDVARSYAGKVSDARPRAGVSTATASETPMPTCRLTAMRRRKKHARLHIGGREGRIAIRTSPTCSAHIPRRAILYFFQGLFALLLLSRLPLLLLLLPPASLVAGINHCSSLP